MQPSPAFSAEPKVLPVAAGDGARSELLLSLPPGTPTALLYWLPAMGIAAKHYLPLAQALSARGVAVALHEWRGIGSSDRRASRRCDWGYRQLLGDDLPAGVAVAQRHCPDVACWLGGHSLGGQIASLYAGQHSQALAGLVLVASGAPYWRQFRHRFPIGLAYVLAPWLAGLTGYLPGRRIGFGGNEARGVIADWARSGRTGRYAAAGASWDLEAGLAMLDVPLLAVRLHDDWLGPERSLDWLLRKMPRTGQRRVSLGAEALGGPADHFSWMKAPDAVAVTIAGWLDDAGQRPSRRAAS